MGKDLADNYEEARRIFEEADRALGSPSVRAMLFRTRGGADPDK